MPWIYLLTAAVFEVVWAIVLKYTEGFKRLVPSVITLAAMYASFYFLSLSVKTLPIGTAYAVWTGIGTTGTAILGMVFFNESRELLRLASIALIILGVVGLKLSSR
jgi:quaternary ammonium compound-resistance protein SugE